MKSKAGTYHKLTINATIIWIQEFLLRFTLLAVIIINLEVQ
jgi:hypothetical protein